MNNLNSTIEQDGETLESVEAKKQRFFNDLANQFAALPMAIFADVRAKKINHRDVCLYMHLLVKGGPKGSSYWGIDSLALLTGTNKTSVKESLRRLLACGHIKRCPGKLTTHTTCLTRLLPGRGIDGIRVKGKEVGADEQTASDDSAPEIQAATVSSPVEEKLGSRVRKTQADDKDAEGMNAFQEEWDGYFASLRAEDQARRWAGIQSRKY